MPNDDTIDTITTTPQTFANGKDDDALPLFDDPDVDGRDDEPDDGITEDPSPKNIVPDEATAEESAVTPA